MNFRKKTFIVCSFGMLVVSSVYAMNTTNEIDDEQDVAAAVASNIFIGSQSGSQIDKTQLSDNEIQPVLDEVSASGNKNPEINDSSEPDSGEKNWRDRIYEAVRKQNVQKIGIWTAIITSAVALITATETGKKILSVFSPQQRENMSENVLDFLEKDLIDAVVDRAEEGSSTDEDTYEYDDEYLDLDTCKSIVGDHFTNTYDGSEIDANFDTMLRKPFELIFNQKFVKLMQSDKTLCSYVIDLLKAYVIDPDYIAASPRDNTAEDFYMQFAVLIESLSVSQWKNIANLSGFLAEVYNNPSVLKDNNAFSEGLNDSQQKMLQAINSIE